MAEDKIKVNVDALRMDADFWDGEAASIAPVADTVPYLHPNDGVLALMFLPAAKICEEANKVVDLFNTLGSEAVKKFGEMGEDLRLNANAYQAQEVEVGQHVAEAY